MVSGKDDKTRTGKGKVLLMDDDEIIRLAFTELLINIGYEIETCEDGLQALSLYEKALKDKNPFDAIIIDLTIPDGMGGKQTMEKLLNIDPDVKGIVSSGFSNDSIMLDYRKYGFCGAVEKPYTVEELNRALTLIIGNKSP